MRLLFYRLMNLPFDYQSFIKNDSHNLSKFLYLQNNSTYAYKLANENLLNTNTRKRSQPQEVPNGFLNKMKN